MNGSRLLLLLQHNNRSTLLLLIRSSFFRFLIFINMHEECLYSVTQGMFRFSQRKKMSIFNFLYFELKIFNLFYSLFTDTVFLVTEILLLDTVCFYRSVATLHPVGILNCIYIAKKSLGTGHGSWILMYPVSEGTSIFS